MDNSEEPRPRPPFWRRWQVVVPALVAIPLVAYLADCGTRTYAESRTADAFQEATDASHAPEVHIHGTPVLTQVARGTLDRVDISAQELPAGAKSPVPVSDLDVHMTKIKKNSDADSAHASSATATAAVTYRDLSDALGIEVKQASTPGRITATISAPLVGDLTVTARLARGGPTSIAFKDLDISSRQLPESAKELMVEALGREIPLENVPQGLTLDRISAGSMGLSIKLSGRNVTFKASELSPATQNRM